MSDHLILIDGSSYLYRAFHAMPNLTNSKGFNTGAIYGVINMLRRLIREYSTDYFIVIFDAPGETFRDRLYSEYKANRSSMPDELRIQIPKIFEVIEALGFKILSVGDVEADDVIGTLALIGESKKMAVTIISGDKDLAQLVNSEITMFDTMKDYIYDFDGVQKKFGVRPDQIVDLLTLTGDTSDNIPGVPKVGPKTAARWLNDYGSLNDLLKNIDDIKGKVGENLRSSMQSLELSRQLVQIKCDVKINQSLGQLKKISPDKEKLRALFAELEFKSWLSELGGLNESETLKEENLPDYDVVLSEDELKIWIKKLKSSSLFSFDTETTSINAMEAKIVGVSFSIKSGKAAYVPFGHSYPDAPAQIGIDKGLNLLKPLLEDPNHHKVGQNLKYDCTVLSNHGISLSGMRYDTMLESYVLNSTGSRHDMNTLALKYLGIKTIHYEDVAGKGKDQVSFDKVPIETAAKYAAEDADVALKLHQVLLPKLQHDDSQARVLDSIEIPLIPVLSEIERTGVKVDCSMLAVQSKKLSKRIEKIELDAYREVGEKFNIASPKQIQEILFGKLDLPVLAKTPKGQPSTAESALIELAEIHKLPKLILEHRGLSKLRSTYTEKLPNLVNSYTGRVHTSYHQAAVATGRLSSSDPNLQNIPIRTIDGKRIREAFITEPGFKVVAADYSQVELRIMAHLSMDKGLLKAFENGEDVHKATASEVFGVNQEDIDDEQRRSAKAINFGLIYGMSAFGLARQLGIERNRAQKYIDKYFDQYPGVRDFMESTRSKVHESKYVETVFGRRLFLSDIGSSNHARRQAAERAAINAPMQGTAADIIKLAMISVTDWLHKNEECSRIIMQVHDELVLEVPDKDTKRVSSKVVELMSGAAKLSVPLQVDVGIGANWAEAHS